MAKMAVWFLVFCFFFTFALNISWAQSQRPNIGNWGNNLDKGVSGTGVYNTKVEGGTAATIAKYIGGILFIAPFLGFMFIVRIVIAGYEWMTAAGNSEKIELAKKRIMNAVIGVIIFAALYFLAYFFVKTFAGLEGYTI